MDIARHGGRNGAEAVPADLDAVLGRVRALLPMLRDRARGVEQAGRVPADSMRLLKEAGVFRLMQPKRFGGLGLGPSSAVRLGWELGRACGSTAWCANVSVNNAWLLSFWPVAVQARAWADDRDALICGTGAPTAGAEAVPGGYAIYGRWPFASNCDNADWVYLSCLLPEPEKGVGWFLVPMDAVRIDDTSWDVCGLKGTGSKTLHADAPILVPTEQVLKLSIPAAESDRNAMTGFAFTTFGPAGLIAPMLGMARRALDWFIDAMRTKMRVVKPG